MKRDALWFAAIVAVVLFGHWNVGRTGGAPDPGPLLDERFCADSNGDGEVDITDAVTILEFLFLGSGQPYCVAQGLTLENQLLTPEQVEILSHLSLVALPVDDSGTTAKTLRIEGVNLQIVNGLGATNGNVEDPQSTETTTTNALGNLIVGYQELEDLVPDGRINERSGSHNIVLGQAQNYTSFGGFVAGLRNTVLAPFAAVSGGVDNTASGEFSSVSGGGGNTADGAFSSVNGGDTNTATGVGSAVSGGADNTAEEELSSVSGGAANLASGIFSQVAGGFGNTASGLGSVVSGGASSTASGEVAAISGGNGNTASGDASSISGGESNTASGASTTVSGGVENVVLGDSELGACCATISGGANNTADGFASTVSGGFDVATDSDGSHIP